MQCYNIYNEVLQCSLKLIVNCSFEDFQKEAEKIMGGETEWPGTIGVRGYSCLLENASEDKMRRFIWIEEFEWTTICMRDLAHEVFHYVAETCEGKDIEFSIKNQEALAYWYDYTYWQCLEKLKPKKKMKKKKKVNRK